MNDISPKERFLSLDNRSLSVAAISFFAAWLLSLPYEGQILYTLAANFSIDAHDMILWSIAVHSAGLLCCGFFIKKIHAARRVMLFAAVVCMAGSGVFFLAPFALWTIALLAISFLAGTWMAAWGFYFKSCTPRRERFKTAAGVLIYPQLLTIGVSMVAIHLSPYWGLGISLVFLTMALLLSAQLPAGMREEAPMPSESAQSRSRLVKPLFFLCLFIAVITINTGLMFQMINPAFAHIGWLSSWYWVVPYIAAIAIIRSLPPTFNRTYILYMAISMIGLSFIAFTVLNRSVLSYLVIETLLLGACGVNDLFWWSILGEMLDFGENPARILGMGLCANVFGVFVGELMANLAAAGSSQVLSLVALTVVCAMFVILPPLHKQLSGFLQESAFLIAFHALPPEEKKRTMEPAAPVAGLSERERQVIALLLKGRTYKMIAKELFLSENTVKTHIKNIYAKLNVRNKTELVKKFAQQA
jgi:DNA-binding CsgD family transcriptional regulator